MSKGKKAKPKTWLYFLGQIILWGYFHVVFRMKVVGAENVPKEGPVLLCSNHLAKRDPVPKAARCSIWLRKSCSRINFWEGCSAGWGLSR